MCILNEYVIKITLLKVSCDVLSNVICIELFDILSENWKIISLFSQQAFMRSFFFCSKNRL